MKNIRYDILVVREGIAGLHAELCLAESGKHVALLEKTSAAEAHQKKVQDSSCSSAN